MKRKDSKGRVLRPGEYERANGQYEYRFKPLIGNKTKSIYASDLYDLRHREKEVAFQEYQPTGENLTLDYVFQMWIDSKIDIRKSSRSTYTRQYKTIIQPYIGEMKIGSITRPQLRELWKMLSEKTGPTSIQRGAMLLQQVMEFAVDEGLIKHNLATGTYLPIVRKTRKEATAAKKNVYEDVFTEREQISLLNFLRTYSDGRLYPLVQLLLSTGIRIGEASALTWDDVDLKKKTLTINKTTSRYQTDEGKFVYEIGPTKTATGTRVIPLMESAIDALQCQKEYYKRHNIKCSEIMSGYTNFVFVTANGKMIMHLGYNNIFARAEASYNATHVDKISHIHAHRLRHTFATRMMENGMNPKALQAILGHATLSMTFNTYVHALPEFKESELAKVEEEMRRAVQDSGPYGKGFSNYSIYG